LQLHEYNLLKINFLVAGQGSRLLKKDSVPSIFPFNRQPSSNTLQSALRGEKRKQEQEMEATSKILVSQPDSNLGGTETITEDIIEEDIISTPSTFDTACTCDIINSNALY